MPDNQMSARVLLVEDKSEWQQIFKDMIEDEKCVVDIESTFDRAFIKLSARNYVLAIVDVFLSDVYSGAKIPPEFERFIKQCYSAQPSMQILVNTGLLKNGQEIFRLRDHPNIAGYLDKTDFTLDEFRVKFRELLRRDARTNSTAPARETVALDLVKGLETLDPARYRVVGSYVRFDGHVRSQLYDLTVVVKLALQGSGSRSRVFCLWGQPGCGKTSLVQQTAQEHLSVDDKYHEVNLGHAMTQTELQTELDTLLRANSRCLCLLDEYDTHPDEPWRFELLLPFLDAAAKRDPPMIVFLAGSSCDDLGSFVGRIEERHKGRDLMSRVPVHNRYTIPPMELGDRLIIALSHVLDEARLRKHFVTSIEKLALYFVAMENAFETPRQLSAFTKDAIDRMIAAQSDRLRFDHLFEPGDRRRNDFWAEIRSRNLVELLDNEFVNIVNPSAGKVS
jgi:DNA-binding response OmpR family regulator